MKLPIKSTIQELTPTVVARETGFPVSTIFRWMQEDRIPGKGPAHDFRVTQFKEAVARIRAAQLAARPKRKRQVQAQAAA